MARVTRGFAARQQAAQSAAGATQEPQQLSSPPTTPDTSIKKESSLVSMRKKVHSANTSSTTPKSTRKRPRAAIKDEEEETNELPHNLGKAPKLGSVGGNSDSGSPVKKSRKARDPRKTIPPKPLKEETTQELVTKATESAQPSSKKAKTNSYGLTPGTTPYPNWPHPTAKECEEVTRLLSSVHGEVKAPKDIPPPSLDVSGCGEVPSVLDALVRTRLSAATSGTNSSRAFAGLVHHFGILQEGIGKGSVDWNKVRLADTKEVFEAIKSGGLADVKSKDIKKILQMVWEENQARREKLIASDTASGSSNEKQDEKNAEIAKAEGNIISLDHLHLLSTDDAFKELTKYPGIGPKTASCVLLFCLQRPSFAVDTHVFRLCSWLGWVPPPGDPALLAPGAKGKPTQANRNSTYAHCEVRIPDHLKYPLHQLFIKHGKSCPRCRAITGENSEGWEKGCAIDHLVKRTGVRKGENVSPVKGPRGKTKYQSKKKKAGMYESDSESSELTDFDDHGEVDESDATDSPWDGEDGNIEPADRPPLPE
ncbi:hypothetical protein N0V90_005486 [Kalmusia sp. IMI 367209]|nr:hypothetical protein N0V90_005486 [Kalmusia sp. IMI 367209]